MQSKLWTRDFTVITLGSVISILGNCLANFASSLKSLLCLQIFGPPAVLWKLCHRILYAGYLIMRKPGQAAKHKIRSARSGAGASGGKESNKMTIFYKMYPYAPLATFVSAMASAFSLLAVIFAVFFFSKAVNESGVLYIVLGVLLVALAGFLFFYVSRKLPDKMAEKETEKNIRTKHRYAYSYCREHPEAFRTLAAENPEFARRYMQDETGKVMKRK